MVGDPRLPRSKIVPVKEVVSRGPLRTNGSNRDWRVLIHLKISVDFERGTT